ncbi:hypothetical protein [Thalassoporum mexicanum]|nr:hypothetical protein [Pseudanabaena sp. PCC 7367]
MKFVDRGFGLHSTIDRSNITRWSTLVVHHINSMLNALYGDSVFFYT